MINEDTRLEEMISKLNEKIKNPRFTYLINAYQMNMSNQPTNADLLKKSVEAMSEFQEVIAILNASLDNSEYLKNASKELLSSIPKETLEIVINDYCLANPKIKLCNKLYDLVKNVRDYTNKFKIYNEGSTENELETLINQGKSKYDNLLQRINQHKN